ncbi:MAG: hypothetical protein GPJ00_19200 [Microcystis aeruginosa W13-18]|nr:hypothetical protein [Microcystis aeruginosa W13-18]NCR15555.1 hypothetical protein [Microcystis aeruginosa SX13-11]NCR19926.1 hypothetical protein [Microcystis aeruginosa LL13-03]NCR37369.1 hypothetical protein [Microcystis aeruginosa S11-05]NCR50898.1 hypothetical protein [Microcystis aeruginosa S11-01]NCR60181.1 hypothetical protein [Microcystis aeruginosa LL13-06]NCR69291.1 hypothetical protein [Microcystis aeruginosa LL11-07]NCR91911.1 hypothetical protein [Microcystis aeruginosa G13
MLYVSNYYKNRREVSKTLQSISLDPQCSFLLKSLIPVDNPFLSPCPQIFPRLVVTNIYKYL